MLTIHKYHIIHGQKYVDLQLPIGAKILTIQMQHNEPFVWALINPDADFENRQFAIYGTGHPIVDDIGKLFYIGTFQMMEGMLVWHFFENIGG